MASKATALPLDDTGVVPERGFEPLTNGVRIRYACQLRHSGMLVPLWRVELHRTALQTVARPTRALGAKDGTGDPAAWLSLELSKKQRSYLCVWVATELNRNWPIKSRLFCQLN